jgi:hypothetical protein
MRRTGWRLSAAKPTRAKRRTKDEKTGRKGSTENCRKTRRKEEREEKKKNGTREWSVESKMDRRFEQGARAAGSSKDRAAGCEGEERSVSKNERRGRERSPWWGLLWAKRDLEDCLACVGVENSHIN